MFCVFGERERKRVEGGEREREREKEREGGEGERERWGRERERERGGNWRKYHNGSVAAHMCTCIQWYIMCDTMLLHTQINLGVSLEYTRICCNHTCSVLLWALSLSIFIPSSL